MGSSGEEPVYEGILLSEGVLLVGAMGALVAIADLCALGGGSGTLSGALLSLGAFIGVARLLIGELGVSWWAMLVGGPCSTLAQSDTRRCALDAGGPRHLSSGSTSGRAALAGTLVQSDRPGSGGDLRCLGRHRGLAKPQTTLNGEMTALIRVLGDKNRHSVGGMGPLTHP
jgi:hypothetical protein